MSYETLILPCDIECRDDDEAPRIVGYAARFFDGTPQTEYQLWQDGPVERFVAGAFTNMLKRNDDVAAVFNHDENVVLGRISNGTLKLIQDQRGLRYEITPPETQQARDLMTLIKRGDVKGSSLQFRVYPNGQAFKRDGGKQVREIRSVQRGKDVGPVTHAAYDGSTVAVRCIDEERMKREFAQLVSSPTKSTNPSIYAIRARAVEVDAIERGILPCRK